MNEMKRIVLATILGSIWGLVGISVGSLILVLMTNTDIIPDLWAAWWSGVGVAFFICFFPKKFFKQLLVKSTSLFLLLLIGFSTMRPWGIHLKVMAFEQWVILLLVILSVPWGIHLCFRGIHFTALSRYQIELILLRMLKGLGLVFLTLAVVLPFYVMLMTSLKSQQALLLRPLDFSIDLSQGLSGLFVSYLELFTRFHFGSFLFNSTIISLTTVMITLFFSIPGAYAVARLRFPGRMFLSRSILLIYMVPAIVLVIPLYSVFSQLQLRNSFFGLLIVYPATTLPVAIYMLQGYFRGLSVELEEAGLMDGLNRIKVILKITIPLALPAITSVSLYVFMIAWNEFLFAFMFLDDLEVFTLSRGIVSLNSSEVPRQHLMAGSVVATIPVMIIFIGLERFLVTGLTAGGVKG